MPWPSVATTAIPPRDAPSSRYGTMPGLRRATLPAAPSPAAAQPDRRVSGPPAASGRCNSAERAHTTAAPPEHPVPATAYRRPALLLPPTDAAALPIAAR